MRIIVDTNVVFSGVLNAGSRIGKILLQSGGHLQFYSCAHLRTELHRHRAKLLKLTKLPEAELAELQQLVTGRINFINEGLLPASVWQQAETLVQAIDADDTPFVALALHLEGTLWTGDMRLYHGLRATQFQNVVTTAELSQQLDELERG